MESKGQTFSHVTEVIDGNQYQDCRFENCKMVFRGGEIPLISGCHFENCQWQFEDAAERTLVFMRQLYHGMGAGGVQLIEATLAQLRQPIPGAPPAQTPGQAPGQTPPTA
jgi:hypothetical protein